MRTYRKWLRVDEVVGERRMIKNEIVAGYPRRVEAVFVLVLLHHLGSHEKNMIGANLQIETAGQLEATMNFSTSMLPPALLELTLLRVSGSNVARLSTRGVPNSLRNVSNARRSMHSAALASRPPPPTPYNYAPASGRRAHDGSSR
jgi:hypothetical protein